MKIKVYSLCRSGHHAISFWLGKNLVPNADVDLTYDNGSSMVKMVTGNSENILTLVENEHLQASEEPTIIILRDPFNNYASFLKLVQNPNFGPLSFFTFMEHWKEYAREVVGETNLLPNKIVISYNDWVESEKYRKDVVKEVEIQFGVKTKFDDSLHKKMTIYGGGSSFDGLEHVNEADRMKVHERYKFYENAYVYRKEVDTPEIKALSEKIFGFYPFKIVEKKPVSDMQKMLEQLLS